MFICVELGKGRGRGQVIPDNLGRNSISVKVFYKRMCEKQEGQLFMEFGKYNLERRFAMLFFLPRMF